MSPNVGGVSPSAPITTGSEK
jgi:hypothetical protein